MDHYIHNRYETLVENLISLLLSLEKMKVSREIKNLRHF
jgi:hypothetical protein